jgi:hypothetical protein
MGGFLVVSLFLAPLVQELNGKVEWDDELEVAVGQILAARKDVQEFQIDP